MDKPESQLLPAWTSGLFCCSNQRLWSSTALHTLATIQAATGFSSLHRQWETWDLPGTWTNQFSLAFCFCFCVMPQRLLKTPLYGTLKDTLTPRELTATLSEQQQTLWQNKKQQRTLCKIDHWFVSLIKKSQIWQPECPWMHRKVKELLAGSSRMQLWKYRVKQA